MDCASLGTQDFLGLSYSRLLPFHHHAKDLVDVCNGLLLFLKSPSCRYYVCNPITKQSVPIPKLCDHRPCLSRYAMLAFDPSKSPHYKIVRFPLFKSSDILWLAVDIFYSESQMWVRHNLKLEPPAVHGHRLCKSSVSLDSVLSRISMSGNLLRIDLNHDDAINAQTIVLPKLEKSVFPGCIGISRSYVCYAHTEKWDIGIWFPEARCQSYEWILQHILPITNLRRHIMIHEFHNFNRVLWFAPFAVHPMNDVIFFGTPNLIVAYDLRSNKNPVSV